ncbi:MAG: glycosyltransferase, partial [Chloroflexota bacterium]
MSTRLRICYIGWADYPHLLRWAKWFAARGHDVHVLSSNPLSAQGITMHDILPAPSGLPRWRRYLRGEVNISAAYWLRTVLRMRRLVKEIRPDILHSHSLYYPGYMGALTGFQPYVVTAWSYDDATLGYAPHAASRPLRRLFARYALGRARLVTGISNDLVQAMVRAGAPPDRTPRKAGPIFP